MANLNDDPQPAVATPDDSGPPANEAPLTAEQKRLKRLGVLACRAFQRDLPQLLQTHYYQWVAYHGDQQFGFGKTKFELYQFCSQRGLQHGEFEVFSVEEPTDDIIIDPLPDE